MLLDRTVFQNQEKVILETLAVTLGVTNHGLNLGEKRTEKRY